MIQLDNPQFQQQSRKAFRTPEGYFDTLTDRIMAQIPEQSVAQKVSLRHNLKTWWMTGGAVAAAAVMAGAIYLLRPAHQMLPETHDAPQLLAQQSDYVDEALDYAMIDNDEIYDYLSEN